MEKISGVVITYNEEKRIEDCLKSLLTFCDEIVIVDSYSTDATLEIASKYTKKIIQRKFDTYVAQKSYATSCAENNWVFCLDADERVSVELVDFVLKLKNDGFGADAYMINRLNYYINGFFKYSGWYPDTKIRLFNRTRAGWGGGDPHETIILKPDASLHKVKFEIIHYTYNNLHHQVEKVNSFSSKAANYKLKKKPKFIRTHFVVNPAIKFIKSYFIQGGFLGGSRGFINAVIASFDVFCKYAKIWEAMHQKEPGAELWQKKNRTVKQ